MGRAVTHPPASNFHNSWGAERPGVDKNSTAMMTDAFAFMRAHKAKPFAQTSKGLSLSACERELPLDHDLLQFCRGADRTIGSDAVMIATGEIASVNPPLR